MINDKIIAKGEVNIKVYKNGILQERIHENNLVVTLGKTNIAKLMGGDAAGKAITQIAVGTSNAATNVTDNVITGAFTKALSAVAYPDPQSVTFSFDIGTAEANGITISEFGLLNADNVLMARKVRDAQILKDVTIRLVGTWTITIN